MGIFEGSLTDRVAKVLKKLGSVHAMVVHGYDGLDEISTTASTKISHLKEDNTIESTAISPSEFEIEKADLNELQGGEPQENANIITDILNGTDTGKKADIVALNAGAGIFVGGKAVSLKEGVSLARESISSGAALEKLQLLAAVQ
jgi:anthranilate phosphoribosyltransferase